MQSLRGSGTPVLYIYYAQSLQVNTIVPYNANSMSRCLPFLVSKITPRTHTSSHDAHLYYKNISHTLVQRGRYLGCFVLGQNQGGVLQRWGEESLDAASSFTFRYPSTCAAEFWGHDTSHQKNKSNIYIIIMLF